MRCIHRKMKNDCTLTRTSAVALTHRPRRARPAGPPCRSGRQRGTISAAISIKRNALSTGFRPKENGPNCVGSMLTPVRSSAARCSTGSGQRPTTATASGANRVIASLRPRKPFASAMRRSYANQRRNGARRVTCSSRSGTTAVRTRDPPPPPGPTRPSGAFRRGAWGRDCESTLADARSHDRSPAARRRLSPT